VYKEIGTTCAFIPKGNASFVEVKSMSDYYYEQLLNGPYLYVIAEADGSYLCVPVQGLLPTLVCQRLGRAHGPPGWLSPGGDRMVSYVGTRASKFFPLKISPPPTSFIRC